MTRTLLSLAALAWLAAAAFPAPAPAPSIVIEWKGGPPDVTQGVELGQIETQQTASLLNRKVELTANARRPFASIRANESGVTIAANERCTFRVLPTDSERAHALERWKQGPAARPGDVAVRAWDPSLQRFGAGELNERFTARFHTPMTEGAWAGWAAVKATVEAALRADVGASGCRALSDIEFDAHKGAMLTFRGGSLVQPLYIVEHASAGDRVVAEVPGS